MSCSRRWMSSGKVLGFLLLGGLGIVLVPSPVRSDDRDHLVTTDCRQTLLVDDCGYPLLGPQIFFPFDCGRYGMGQPIRYTAVGTRFAYEGGRYIRPASTAWVDQRFAVDASLPGYTRPGLPAIDEKLDGNMILPADVKMEDAKKAVGGTVYYMVLDLSRGKEGDSWGTGVKGFNSTWLAGVDFRGVSSPGLDTTARYLYLYQTVNDRNTTSAIRSTSIRLLVEPEYITSWGHFQGNGFYSSSAARPAGATGIKPAADDNGAGDIRAVSMESPIVSGEKVKSYRNPDVAHPVEMLQIGKIPGADGREPGKNPSSVMLLASAFDFENQPCFRAMWNENNMLKKGNRSCLYGFTSNLPPTLAAARLRGIQVGAIQPASTGADAGVREIGVAPDGEVPTPITEAVADMGFTPGGNVGLLGGMGAGGGGGFGGGGIPLATYSRPSVATGASAIGSGGGSGNGQGSGNGNGTGTGSGTATNNQNVTVVVNQQQAQQQAQLQIQQQSQQQSQKNKGSGSKVVPEPSAFLLAAAGLPLLAFLRYRRKVATSAQ